MLQKLTGFLSEQNNAGKNPSLPGSDRRRMERIRRVVTIACRSVTEESEFTIVTDNINMQGARFTASRKLSEGEILSLKLMLSTGQRNIEARGQIVWLREREANGTRFYEGGIEFIDLTKRDRKNLQIVLYRQRPPVIGPLSVTPDLRMPYRAEW